jgi:ribosomal protein S7
MSFGRVTPARRNATAMTFIAAKSNLRDRTEIERRLKVLFS